MEYKISIKSLEQIRTNRRDKKSIEKVILFDLPADNKLILMVDSHEERRVPENKPTFICWSINVVKNPTQELVFIMDVHLPVPVKAFTVLLLNQTIKLLWKHSDLYWACLSLSFVSSWIFTRFIVSDFVLHSGYVLETRTEINVEVIWEFDLTDLLVFIVENWQTCCLYPSVGDNKISIQYLLKLKCS